MALKMAEADCPLRWLKTISSTKIFMGCYSHSLSLDATIVVSKNCLTRCHHFRNIIGYHSNSMTCLKHLGTEIFFLFCQHLIRMIKRNFWQSLKKIPYVSFRATLNYENDDNVFTNGGAVF